MLDNLFYDSSHLANMRINEIFGKYSLHCKTGYFCDFNIMQLSNLPHSHNCYELCIIISGEGTYYCAEESHKLSSGDLIIARPGIVHEIKVNRMQDLTLVFFQFQIMDNVQSSPKTREDNVIAAFLESAKTISTSQKHLLAYLVFIQDYFAARKQRSYGIQQALKNLMLESLDAFAQNSGNLNKVLSVDSSAFEKALLFIDHNLNRKISVSEIADQASVSTRTLQLLFRKHTNQTIIDYVNERKMTLAAHHLMKQDSISETAAQLGYSNASQLTRLFKKYKYITPKSYQQQHITIVKEFGRRQHKMFTKRNT